MKYQPPAEGLHRERFPNGRPSSEYAIKDGRMEGVSLRWHPNGVMSHEEHYHKGLRHGLTSQWNAKGELLGTCDFKEGTGILRQWHENGQLSLELSYFNGRETGRMRWWEKDGMLYGTRYFFEGRPISKKGYLEKCSIIPELPRFEEEKTTNTLGNFVRKLKKEKQVQAKLGPTPDQLEEKRRFAEECEAETKKKSSKELLGWLTKGTKIELGEMSRSEALKFARKVYALGAVKVWALGVEHDPDGAQYARRLILLLPDDTAVQGKIYQYCTAPARPYMGDSGPAIRLEKNYLRVSLL